MWYNIGILKFVGGGINLKLNNQKDANEVVIVEDRAEDISARLEEMLSLEEAIQNVLKSHEEGGTCYRTTKLLLSIYRKLRFQIVEDAALTTFDVLESYGYKDAPTEDDMTIKLISDLDYVLALPDNMLFCSNKIKRFLSSSEPATIGQFIALVDSGMKSLQEQDPQAYAILNLMYCEKTEHSIDYYIAKFDYPRSTFFRKRNDAITLLSICIFGLLAEKHPGTEFAGQKNIL